MYKPDFDFLIPDHRERVSAGWNADDCPRAVVLPLPPVHVTPAAKPEGRAEGRPEPFAAVQTLKRRCHRPEGTPARVFVANWDD